MNIIPRLTIIPQRKNSVKLLGKHCETPWLKNNLTTENKIHLLITNLNIIHVNLVKPSYFFVNISF